MDKETASQPSFRRLVISGLTVVAIFTIVAIRKTCF